MAWGSPLDESGCAPELSSVSSAACLLSVAWVASEDSVVSSACCLLSSLVCSFCLASPSFAAGSSLGVSSEPKMISLALFTIEPTMPTFSCCSDMMILLLSSSTWCFAAVLVVVVLVVVLVAVFATQQRVTMNSQKRKKLSDKIYQKAFYLTMSPSLHLHAEANFEADRLTQFRFQYPSQSQEEIQLRETPATFATVDPSPAAVGGPRAKFQNQHHKLARGGHGPPSLPGGIRI
mmetsp:Transcript_8213/g.15089  ORF Transcript_8213/g.15089 Transcript_8213/m.15089 type:complete len:234 (-) Transcript_8213:460-1161(-)